MPITRPTVSDEFMWKSRIDILWKTFVNGHHLSSKQHSDVFSSHFTSSNSDKNWSKRKLRNQQSHYKSMINIERRKKKCITISRISVVQVMTWRWRKVHDASKSKKFTKNYTNVQLRPPKIAKHVKK